MDEWYYVDANRQQEGPHETAKLKKLWNDKVIDAETLVWKEDQDGWKTIAVRFHSFFNWDN